MEYSLFYTDQPIPSGRMPDLSRVIPIKMDSLGAAITAACKLISGGAVVWRIKGVEGFVMEREDIETEYWRRCGGQPTKSGIVPL
jgi:hypothetical protein